MNQIAALYAQESLTSAGQKMQHKSFDLIEAKADPETGTFEALVSVFGNVDSVGDRILPGAFKASLEKWDASGDPIPVILSHDWQNPWSHIGVVHPGDAKETDRGLLVKGHLDVKDNDVAKQVHRLMQRRSLKEFSFGYRVVKETKSDDGANDLQDLDLIEVGPTLKGANPATELHAVKSALEEENQPPPDETEIRKELERHKADEAVDGVVVAEETGPSELEQLSETVAQMGEQLAAVKEQVEKVPPPPEAVIRQELVAHNASEEIKDVPVGDPPPTQADVLAEMVQHLEQSMAVMAGQVEKALEKPPTPPPSESQIRQELMKHTVAEETKDVPKGDAPPTPVELLSEQVSALTVAIGEMATTVDEKLKALEAAVEEPHRANSTVDQRFRKEATMTVVDLDSDGARFSKPPEQKDPEPDREAEWALKARARREIYDLLND